MVMYKNENAKVKRKVTEKTYADGTTFKDECICNTFQNEFGNRITTETHNEYTNGELTGTKVFTYERVNINPLYLDLDIRDTYDVIVDEMTRPDKSCLRYIAYINKTTKQINKTEICNYDSSKKRSSKKVITRFKQNEDTIEVTKEYNSSDTLTRTIKTVYDKNDNVKSRDQSERNYTEFMTVSTEYDDTDSVPSGNYMEYKTETSSSTANNFKPDITIIRKEYKNNKVIEERRSKTMSTEIANAKIEYSYIPYTKRTFKYDNNGNITHTEHYYYDDKENTYKLSWAEDRQYDNKNRVISIKENNNKIYNKNTILSTSITIEYID